MDKFLKNKTEKIIKENFDLNNVKLIQAKSKEKELMIIKEQSELEGQNFKVKEEEFKSKIDILKMKEELI